MYHYLEEFGITVTSSCIKVAELSQGRDFTIDAKKSLPPQECQKKQVMLRGWYRSANRHDIRQNQSRLRQFAKNLVTNRVF